VSTTYLNIMNEVLRRLREAEVADVTENTYSKMVGDFINDAKRNVEDSHDWSTLRTTIVVSTSAGTTDYSLTNAGERIKVYSAINDTSNFFMKYESPNWFNNAYYISGEVSGTPDSYTFIGIDSNEDSKIRVYPKPDATYSLRFDLIAREDELSSSSDTTLLPKNAIVHSTLALLSRERGETGGTSTQDYFALADRHLSDAIAHDAYKNPEEFIFRVP